MSNIDEKNQKVIEKGVEIKNFTQKDNGSIMNKSQSVYNTLRDTLKAEKTNVIKNPLYNRNPATASGKKSNEAINTPEYSTQKLNKTSGASLNQGLNAQSYIPKEKKEQERLKRLTGTHDLKKVEPAKLDNHIRLKNKTPDDYYDIKLPYYELNRRIDRDAFGPKTDFSINNFENNFDKMNLEEQSMMAYKMQREFNNLGYKDKDGYSLKTDGIFGDKTKYVYEQYKKDNYNELSDDFKEKQKLDDENKKYEDMALKGSDGKPLLIASNDRDLSKLFFGNISSIQALPSNLSKSNVRAVTNANNITKEYNSHKDIYYKPKDNQVQFGYTTNYINNNETKQQKSENRKEEIRKNFTNTIANIIKTENLIEKILSPKNHWIKKQTQRLVWKLGSEIILKNDMNCNTAAWMLEHSLQDKPEKVVRDNNSSIAYKINNSTEYLEALDKAIANSNSGIIDQDLEIKPFSDNDLYLSINKAKIHVKGYRDSNGMWNISATMTDTYDFTEILFIDNEMSNIKKLGTVANDVAFVSQLTDAITPYEIEVNFYTRRKSQ